MDIDVRTQLKLVNLQKLLSILRGEKTAKVTQPLTEIDTNTDKKFASYCAVNFN